MMTELEALRYADSGRATYTTDRFLTIMGEAGYWKLEQTGVQSVTPYVAHGGFYVDSWATFRSVLTDKGKRRLAMLERCRQSS